MLMRIAAQDSEVSRRAQRTLAFFTSILRKGIRRISRINKAGATNGQKAFDFTHRFGDHAVRLAGVKLALQLNKGVISPIKPAC